jgi:hypothetical protein
MFIIRAVEKWMVLKVIIFEGQNLVLHAEFIAVDVLHHCLLAVRRLSFLTGACVPDDRAERFKMFSGLLKSIDVGKLCNSYLGTKSWQLLQGKIRERGGGEGNKKQCLKRP